MLTNRSYAYVHFFDKDDSPGFRAIADCNLELNTNETYTFYSNSGSEIVEVENECVVSIDKAIEVVEEFFTTKKCQSV